MFPFTGESKKALDSKAVQKEPTAAPPEPHPLDDMTGGVFSAATSGERAQRLREWLDTDPDAADMQNVYKELSAKDKGAARPLRDRLDELRRAKAQDAMVAKWQEKAEALLAAERLNIADGLAWERDAAAAGAPLSREPLAGLRTQLSERIRAIEDLQQRVMVQVEAAALLTQRVELLSTKSWRAAQEARGALQNDLADWKEQAAAIMTEPQWSHLDLRYPPQLESARDQLDAVWTAFVPALEQAVAASDDEKAALPPVQVWADELRAARAGGGKPAADPARSEKDAQKRDTAAKVVQAGVKLLEHAVAAGNTKDVNSARQALRRTLKTHGQWIDDALEARVHAALVSAGELQGWQRWSADKVREQLVARAEALLRKRKVKPAAGAGAEPVPGTDTESVSGAEGEPAASEAEPGTSSAAVPEATIAPAGQPPAAADREAKPAATEAEPGSSAAAPEATAAPADQPPAAADEGATATADPSDAPAAQPAADEPAAAQASHEDAAPLAASSAARRQEEELPIEAGYVWEPTLPGRKLQETLRKLRDEWKAADAAGGAANQALWRRFDRACNTAHAFVVQWLEKVRAEEQKSLADREALMGQLRDWAAKQTGGSGTDWKKTGRDLRKFAQRWRNAGHVAEKLYQPLQQQWKEAMAAASAPLEQEQKASRARRQDLIAQAEALGAEPNLRISAVKALQASWQAEARAVPLNRKREQKLWEAFRKPIDEAFKRKDAERERRQAAASAHDQAVLAAAQVLEEANASGDANRIREAMAMLKQATQAQPPAVGDADAAAAKAAADAAPDAAAPTPPPEQTNAEVTAEEAPAAEPDAEGALAAADDAAGAERKRPVVAVRGDDRPDIETPRRGRREPTRGRDGRRQGGDRRGDYRRGRDRAGRDERRPAISHSARRAQKQAVEKAQTTLRQLAVRAHGEALVELLSAWRDNSPDQVPEARDFGRAVTSSMRSQWQQALGRTGADAEQSRTALLRLEEAAETPSPADQVDARRQLKLQLLTQRDDPSPAETWPEDVQTVLASGYDETKSNRLQKALKILLHKS